MKRLIVYMFSLVGKIWSYIYTVSLHGRISILYNLIYSAWLSRSFKSFGKNSVIKKSCHLLGGRYITVGRNVTVGRNAVINAWDRYNNQTFSPEIIIGDEVSIGEYAHISAINKITVGNGVLTGRWLTIVDNSHGKININELNIPPICRILYSKGAVQIEDNVWIGDKVTILSGVNIGKNTIIGANSVVTKSVPQNCIAAGNPATIIKLIS